MDTNSVHSHSEVKEAKERKGEIQYSPIHESICDSLDHHMEKNEKIEEICRASQYGFGEQLMQKFMGEL